jgi:2',3'-cyclic-nucleotide 2'-phosphodiesterase (5'-nucleotidase family)
MKPCTVFGTIALLVGVAQAFAQLSDPAAHGPSQVAADFLKEAASTDGAFVASGMVRSNFQKDDLSTLIQFPDDEIVIVILKGSELRQAFERSVSLYPQANASFLQVSGFEITFSPDGSVGQRIKSISVNNLKLEEAKEYSIAMPSSLGRGGYGYYRIWDRAKITKTLDLTVGKVLAGKKSVESKPRWIVQSS